MKAPIEAKILEIEEKEREIRNFDKRDYKTEEDFNTYLDASYGQVNICGNIYSASYALKELDHVAYNEEFHNYIDGLELEEFSEYEDLIEDLASLQCELEDLESELEDLESR